MRKFSNGLRAALVLAASAVASLPAFAADPIDVTAVTTAIPTYVGPIGEIGGAVLLVLLAVKGFKWVRRAM